MSDLFAKRMNLKGSTLGQTMKRQSDLLMDVTFTQDKEHKLATLYNCDFDVLEENVDIKFQFSQNYTINKDQVEYLVQFRPGYHPEKIYKWKDKKERLGFYLAFPDDVGEINIWLIVGKNDKEFTRYNVLKCNWTFQYIANGELHSILGVLRNRNNYNSGVWSDGFTTTVENQAQFIIPTNRQGYYIDYDTRFMLSDNPIKPLVYSVTKREDTFPLGVYKVTLCQAHYNPATDCPELLICDYYNSPLYDGYEDSQIKLSCSGSNRTLYIGGSERTITATEQNESEEVDDTFNVEWSFSLNNQPKTLDEFLEDFNVKLENTSLKISAKDNFNLLGSQVEVIANTPGAENHTSIYLEVKR